MKITIPEKVNKVLDALQAGGHDAFVVGGCVRDAVMGKTPSDWDVTTSARPDAIKACFADFKTIDTGIQHGTVAVLMDGELIEITTYRIDGEYLDGRHPKSVAFTENLEEDLARRDFTMNAMAYSPVLGLFDPFGGRDAIAAKKIICVGEPKKRFEEDALRIMRGLRFASVLGFAIDSATLTAMGECANLMKKVSVERINVEFSKLILGKAADNILDSCCKIIKAVIWEMADAEVDRLPRNLITRLAVLFPDETERALRRLKYDNQTIKKASLLNDMFRRYSAPPCEKVEILTLLRDYGEEVAWLYYAAYSMTDTLTKVKDGACWKIADLNISGRDILEAGFPKGPEVGKLLNELLDLVIAGEIENNREKLLEVLMWRKERVK